MTATDHLLRDLAPIPAKAWEEIESEARSRLTPQLAARRVTDWSGPHGWRADRLSVGRVTTIAGPRGGTAGSEVQTAQRRVLPYAEIRVPFTVRRREIDDIQRGATDADLDDLRRAARAAAITENRAVFHGWPDARIDGLTAVSGYPTVALGEDCQTYPAVVAQAVDRMRGKGIGGPYALAISPERYTRIVETTEHGGYLLLDHLKRILEGKIVWTPGLDGAVVVSERGGDFLLDVGQDMAIGYSDHDADAVHLYLEESLAFRVVEPDAAVALS